MPNTLQEFLVVTTQKASDELIAALQRLPEDKRGWSPAEQARSAFDQVAECAILNGYTANLIQTRVWPSNGFEAFLKAKAELLSQGWEALHALLQENTLKAIAAIRSTPDDVLQTEIVLPFATTTLAEVLAYPYWNMSYHQGQINYIASILGCLT